MASSDVGAEIAGLAKLRKLFERKHKDFFDQSQCLTTSREEIDGQIDQIIKLEVKNRASKDVLQKITRMSCKD